MNKISFSYRLYAISSLFLVQELTAVLVSRGVLIRLFRNGVIGIALI